MTDLRTNELDGRRVAYSSETEFLVQVGLGRGSYRTRYAVRGNLAQAVHLFNGLNIGNGYKKRLVSWGFNRPVIARQFSR